MEIILPPDLREFIEEKVRIGQFESPAAVICGALEAMREEERLTSEDLAEMREAVNIGLEQLARGESAEWNVEEDKAELLKRARQLPR